MMHDDNNGDGNGAVTVTVTVSGESRECCYCSEIHYKRIKMKRVL